jgi:hypothetical protein
MCENMIHNRIHRRFKIFIGQVPFSIDLLFQWREELSSQGISFIVLILISQYQQMVADRIVFEGGNKIRQFFQGK